MTQKIYSMLLSLFLSINCLSAQVLQTVNVPTAGSLLTAIGSNLQTVTDLTLIGTINATDFQTIKQMIALKNLDMSKVSITDNTIPASAFQNRTLNSLVLPENLEVIGAQAFSYLSLKDGLILPKGLKKIGLNSFIYMNVSSLDFSICSDLQEIGVNPFKGLEIKNNTLDFSKNSKLTRFLNVFWQNENVGSFYGYTGHVVLPENLKEIPSYTFSRFKGTVKLPAGLEIIGEQAFSYSSLRDGLILPKGLKKVGLNSFIYMDAPFLDFSICSNLEEVGVNPFKGLKINDNTLDFSKNSKLTRFLNVFWQNENVGSFYDYTGHVTLPENLKEIPSYTFFRFKGTIDLPETLKSIGTNAFQNSTIKKIDLPASVTSIGSNAFYNVTQLDTIISRNATPPTLGTNVFYGVNKETTQLKLPNNSINLYGAAAQWKDFTNISISFTAQADPFAKGKEGSVYISIPTNTTEGIDMQGWDYDNNKIQDGQPIVKTYKTIEIDEYTWLSENLRLKYKWNDWMNLTQADVDNYSNFYLGGKKISLSQFEDIFGTWVSLYPKALSYQSQFTVFSSKGGSTEKGWQLPSSADIWQLYGLAPRKSGNIYKDVQDFLFMSPCENDLDLRKNMMNRDNISGLTLTPLGMRESFYGDEAKIYGFGTLVGLRTNGWTRIEAISDLATSGILPGMRSLDLYHFSQARYIKPKTDKELGYKIYIDTTNDKVLMLPYDQVSTLPELEKGLERGIALRYANRKEKQIVKKWSEIQAEAAEIRNALIAVNVPQPLPACDRPVIEDGPDPYQKGKEGSIHIWISENGADGDGVCFQAYDFDTNQERGINQGFQGTYKTIGVGEYDYTEENLKAIGRDRWGTYYSWFRWTDNNIASITHSFSQETPLSVIDFTKIYGSWFSRLPAVFAYANPNHVIFRDKEGGSIQQGWGLPSITDILQMIGQAPSTGNINYDILNFTGASNKDVPTNHQADWYNRYKNISGLTLTPLGSRHPIEGNLATDVYAFKVLSKIRLKDNGNRATFNFYVSGSFFGAEDDHYSQVRYTRAKSDEELGYKLYIDNCNDQVVMLPYTQKTNLVELPKGLERGIALRYANRKQMKIYKTWSEICKEADQIRNSFENLPARENFNFPECVEQKPDPETPENPDPENPESPDPEIAIETYPAEDIDRIDKISFAYDLAGNRVKKEIILTSTRSLIEEDQTFVDDINKFQVTIFPNPTKGLITIAIKDFVSTDVTNKLTVFDLNGRVVAQEKITTNTAQVDISSQSRGTYILVISIDGKSSSWKIIKE